MRDKVSLNWRRIGEIAPSSGTDQPLNVILFDKGKTGQQEAVAKSGDVRGALSAHGPGFNAAELTNRIGSGEIRKIAIVDWLIEL